MNPDYNKAAAMAADTLMKYHVATAPVSPLRILEQIEDVIVISFAEMSDSAGLHPQELIPLFGRGRDAVTSVHMDNGRQVYLVAYNSLLPFGMIQRALAREIGHIVMHHTECTPENTAEAECFMYHLICPRALIHAIQATGMRFTEDLLANLTGMFGQSLVDMRRIPETTVHISLNRFVRTQFMPFLMNFFDFYQNVMPRDGSALADLGTYMNGYEE